MTHDANHAAPSGVVSPNAPDELAMAVERAKEIAAAIEYGPGEGISFLERGAVKLAADLRLILSRLAFQEETIARLDDDCSKIADQAYAMEVERDAARATVKAQEETIRADGELLAFMTAATSDYLASGSELAMAVKEGAWGDKFRQARARGLGMSESSDPSFSTTETLIASVRRDLGEVSKRMREADAFSREAMATMWEIDRRQKAMLQASPIDAGAVPGVLITEAAYDAVHAFLSNRNDAEARDLIEALESNPPGLLPPQGSGEGGE